MIMNLILFSSFCQKYHEYVYITRWNYEKSALTSNKSFLAQDLLPQNDV